MSHVEYAQKMFMEGCNCAQAVLSFFGPDIGMDKNTCCSVAAAFGAGIAYSQQTCGAVTGAVMVIGLQTGAKHPDVSERTTESYQTTKEFLRRFTAMNGSVNCRELLGADITTPEGLAHARESGIFETRCTALISSAIEILKTMTGEGGQ
jgi:C_GCAxxG_C_C family probable redox protein